MSAVKMYTPVLTYSSIPSIHINNDHFMNFFKNFLYSRIPVLLITPSSTIRVTIHWLSLCRRICSLTTLSHRKMCCRAEHVKGHVYVQNGKSPVHKLATSNKIFAFFVQLQPGMEVQLLTLLLSCHLTH